MARRHICMENVIDDVPSLKPEMQTLGGRFAILAPLLIAGSAVQVNAQVVLDFNSVSIPAFQREVLLPAPYQEDGFIVGVPSGGCGAGTASPVVAVAKGPAAQFLEARYDRQFWVIAEQSNGTFDALAMDLVIGGEDGEGNTIDILGIRADGTTVSIVREVGATAMPLPGFTGLTALVIANRGSLAILRIDNIVLDNVQPGGGFPTGQTTIDFEEVVLPEEFEANTYGRLYYRDGYILADINEDTETQFRFLGSGAFGHAGSKALYGVDLTFEDFAQFWMSRIDGAPFWIESVDVAALEPYQQNPYSILLFTNDEINEPFEHSEPEPDSPMPTFVTYDYGIQNDECLTSRFRERGGDRRIQIDNIVVTTIEPQPACPADFNGDASRDVADLFAYINAWLAKSTSADFNDDSAVDVADLFAYINAWLAGC